MNRMRIVRGGSVVTGSGRRESSPNTGEGADAARTQEDPAAVEKPRQPGLSLRWVVNGLEFGCASRSLRDILIRRVPTSWAVPGGSADGEDRLGC
jgi:hypothetical protein